MKDKKFICWTDLINYKFFYWLNLSWSKWNNNFSRRGFSSLSSLRCTTRVLPRRTAPILRSLPRELRWYPKEELDLTQEVESTGRAQLGKPRVGFHHVRRHWANSVQQRSRKRTREDRSILESSTNSIKMDQRLNLRMSEIQGSSLCLQSATSISWWAPWMCWVSKSIQRLLNRWAALRRLVSRLQPRCNMNPKPSPVNRQMKKISKLEILRHKRQALSYRVRSRN